MYGFSPAFCASASLRYSSVLLIFFHGVAFRFQLQCPVSGPLQKVHDTVIPPDQFFRKRKHALWVNSKERVDAPILGRHKHRRLQVGPIRAFRCVRRLWPGGRSAFAAAVSQKIFSFHLQHPLYGLPLHHRHVAGHHKKRVFFACQKSGGNAAKRPDSPSHRSSTMGRPVFL